MNRITIIGTLNSPILYSHTILHEDFYTSTLQVKRKSGIQDVLPVTLPGKILQDNVPADSDLLKLTGQVRSYNRVVDGVNRLILTIFVQDLSRADDKDDDTLNNVEIAGFICKTPSRRSTPLGRDICDMMLAVNRPFGKSDYLPCIAWGRNAKFAESFRVGDRVFIAGRLQSREYRKVHDDGSFEIRSAIEISIFSIENDSIIKSVV